MTPWSVTATAGLPCSAALSTRSRMRDAPSRSENSVWLCRCTKPSLPISPPPDDNPLHPHRRHGTESAGRSPPDLCGNPGEGRWISLQSCNSSGRHSTLGVGRVQQERSGGVRLSYSSINTYETCPAKYRFQYEDRLPTASSPALTFGDVLHRALFRFHDRPVPVAPSLEELQGFLDDEWSEEGYRDPGEESLYRDHARQVLTSYHRENADQFRIPAALEFR